MKKKSIFILLICVAMLLTSSSGYKLTSTTAVSKAISYLNYSAFSKEGLIEQLEYEGFSSSEAEYGVSQCGANWNDQAALKAASYLDYSAFSKKGLIEQLEYEGFSSSEAEYGVNHCGVNWNGTSSNSSSGTNTSAGKNNAIKQAVSYLKYSAFSYKGLIEQLEYEGYSNIEAEYGADNCGANWNEQAAKCAKSYLKYGSFSHSGLIKQLEYEGFTLQQATYGCNAVGY